VPIVESVDTLMSFREVQSIFSPDCPSDSRSVAHDPERQMMKMDETIFLITTFSFIHSLAKLRLFNSSRKTMEK
jgi:hypothetical protein